MFATRWRPVLETAWNQHCTKEVIKHDIPSLVLPCLIIVMYATTLSLVSWIDPRDLTMSKNAYFSLLTHIKLES